MIMKRKILSMILAAAMAGTLLVGCGGSSGEPASNTAVSEEKKESTAAENTAGETTADTDAAELEFVKLTWYFRSDSYPEQDLVYEEANKIIKEAINAEVEFIPIAPSDYEQKMQTKYAAGEAGDINFTSSWTNKYLQNVSKGAFYPMDELLEKYAPEVKAYFPEEQWNAVRVKGEIYGIPNAQIFAKTGNLSVRKDLALKYSLDITAIKQLADLEPFLEQVTKEEGAIFERYDKAGGFGQLTYTLGFDDISAFTWMKYDDKELKIVNPYATQEFKDYCLQAKDWADKGYTANDAMVKKDMEAEIKANKIAARSRGVYKPGVEIQEAASSWAPGVEIVAAPLGESVLSTSGITSTISAIPSTSKNPERAMMLLELVNTNAELFNLISYGIQGQHYEVVADNMIRQINTDKYKGTPWMMGNTFNGYILEGSPADLNEATLEMNNNAYPSEALGFSFDAEPVKTQIAQVQTVYDEFFPALNCGNVDDVEASLAEYQEKLEGAGINEIVAEAQKQIDEWAATK